MPPYLVFPRTIVWCSFHHWPVNRCMETCRSPPQVVRTSNSPFWVGCSSPPRTARVSLARSLLGASCETRQTESPPAVQVDCWRLILSYLLCLSLRPGRKLNRRGVGCSSRNLLVAPHTLGFSEWLQIDCLMIYTPEPQTFLLRLEFLTEILSLEPFFFFFWKIENEFISSFCIKLNIRETCWEGGNEKEKVQAHLCSY